jgi:hypothetical protein
VSPASLGASYAHSTTDNPSLSWMRRSRQFASENTGSFTQLAESEIDLVSIFPLGISRTEVDQTESRRLPTKLPTSHHYSSHATVIPTPDALPERRLPGKDGEQSHAACRARKRQRAPAFESANPKLCARDGRRATLPYYLTGRRARLRGGERGKGRAPPPPPPLLNPFPLWPPSSLARLPSLD